MYKRQIVMLAILAMAVIYIGTACECEQPVIQSITPSSGPGGTIVEVVYTKGGISGTIEYEGSSVPTRNAGNIGIGKTLFFTIPYDATAGTKQVAVESGGKTSAPVNFSVTGSGTVPTPTIEGFEVPNSSGKEITVFGSNFSTLSEVYINGTEVDHYYGSSMPFREIPHDMVDNVIICSPASNLATGSSYNIQVKNPGGVNSAVFNATIPSRILRMEFDAIVGIDPPEYYIWRNSTVNTLRRSYTTCGWIIDLIYDDLEIPDPVTGDFSENDLYSFWQAHADNRLTGAYYMHGSFVDNGGGLGVMYMNQLYSLPSIPDANRREGFAVFFSEFSATQRTERYLRTTIHEAGHGFNLLHGDRVAGTTIMNQTGDINSATWNYTFSNTSCTHLQTHSLTAVGPGGDQFGTVRSCNSSH